MQHCEYRYYACPLISSTGRWELSTLAPNAALQARGTAAATQERRLFPVACKRWFGWECPVGCGWVPPIDCNTLLVPPDVRSVPPHRSHTHAYWSTSSARNSTIGGIVSP